MRNLGLPKGVFLTGDRIVIKEAEEIIFYKIVKNGNSVSFVCVGSLEHGSSFKMSDELYNKISSKLFDIRHALV